MAGTKRPALSDPIPVRFNVADLDALKLLAETSGEAWQTHLRTAVHEYLYRMRDRTHSDIPGTFRPLHERVRAFAGTAAINAKDADAILGDPNLGQAVTLAGCDVEIVADRSIEDAPSGNEPKGEKGGQS